MWVTVWWGVWVWGGEGGVGGLGACGWCGGMRGGVEAWDGVGIESHKMRGNGWIERLKMQRK